MSSPKLRLLLDESVTDPLAVNILKICPSAVYARKNPKMKGREDGELAILANADDRTIVALDSDYKQIDVKAGVIKLDKNRSNEDCLFAIFKAFWQSGHRQKSRTRRTYLTNEGVRIVNGEPFELKWQPRPCAHHGSHH